MKVFISADIEGICGVTAWDETEHGKPEYAAAREQMTAETAAACAGALAAGADEIWVKDAHGSGRNLIPGRLPEAVRLVRGWSGHPFSMVQELDASFAALIMIGYHSPAGAESNPLAHTMNGRIARIRFNGTPVSEFLLYGLAAALRGVPVAFVSGDAALCDLVHEINPHIAACAVKQGVGNSTVNLHPRVAAARIQSGVESTLKAGDLDKCCLPMPETFTVEIRYRKPADAFRNSFYPGAEYAAPDGIRFETRDYFEVLRLMLFT